MARRKKNKIDSNAKIRLISISLFLFMLFCLLIIQFYKIQIIEGEKWAKQGQAQHQYTKVDPFMRGRFFSNPYVRVKHPEKIQTFVMDVPKFHLFIDPLSIPIKYKDFIANKIFEITRPSLEKKEKVMKDFYRKSRSRKIFTWLDSEDKEKINNWWFAFARKEKIAKNAIYFTLDYKRSYPFGSSLGQLLHTVQEEKEPHTFQCYPTGGLELFFNDYLKGKQGIRLIVRSPRHPLDVGKVIDKPQNGADIYLTINHCLQAIIEEELEKGVKRFKAKGGWSILMDPNSGEILALAQYPFFDLSHYNRYFNDQNLQDQTRLKAVTDSFEPASIFKPIILAVCLKANEILAKNNYLPIFTPYEKVPTH